MAKCDGFENRRGESPAQVRILYPPQRTKSKIFTLLSRLNSKNLLRDAFTKSKIFTLLSHKIMKQFVRLALLFML